MWAVANFSSPPSNVDLYNFTLFWLSCSRARTGVDVIIISQTIIETSLVSKCTSQLPRYQEDPQIDKNITNRGRGSMLRIFLGKLRSGAPGGRQKWVIRKFPSLQYPQLYKYQKFPKHTTCGDQNLRWPGSRHAAQLCWVFAKQIYIFLFKYIYSKIHFILFIFILYINSFMMFVGPMRHAYAISIFLIF